MNDRYLYRAKRTDNGEWISGDLITTPFIRNGTLENIPYILDITKAYYDCFEELVEGNGIFEVDPSTICQCTGLKDKSGKLIWENDILCGYLDDSYPENATYEEVLWWRNGFYTREKGSNDVNELDAFTEQNFEVCGNIFDNPELLEVGA